MTDVNGRPVLVTGASGGIGGAIASAFIQGGAHVVAVATEGNARVAEYAEEVLEVPRTDWLLQPLLAVIPLQLLAYHIARARGLNVDQPRNLAKTVTVE